MKEKFKTDMQAKSICNNPDGKAHTCDFHCSFPGSLILQGLQSRPGIGTWRIMYRVNKKQKKFKIGVYPAMQIKAAKTEAARILGEIAAGNDPQQQRTAYQSAPTMCDLWDLYLGSQKLKTRQKAITTQHEERRKWKVEVKPIIGDMKVCDVTGSQLADILDDVARRAPVASNRLHSFLRVLFKPAVRHGWIQYSPMASIEKTGGAEVPRQRYLTDAEIKTLWPFFDAAYGNGGDILKLLLLTAQRPGEIMSMRWQDIDFDNRLWTLSNTKTGNDHLIPLSKPVLKILQRRKSGYPERVSWKNDSEYVFPSRHNRQAGHTKSVNRLRKKIQQDSGIIGWTSHDLRRTARTLMSRLSIPHHVRERVLNHSVGKIQATYDRYDYLEEKRKALDLLGQEIVKITGPALKVLKVVNE